jgi:hypothetical protein
MKRLPPGSEDKLVAILRKAAGRRVNARQACFDFAGIVSRLPAAVDSEAHPVGRGRPRAAIRVLAELAADTYFFHTGKGPGHAENETGWRGGCYPAFVAELATAEGIDFDRRRLTGICREVRRSLSKRAGLSKRMGAEERAKARGELLVEHVAGEDEIGFAIFSGYEPARDPDFDAAKIFKTLGSRRERRSAPQAKRPLRSQQI